MWLACGGACGGACRGLRADRQLGCRFCLVTRLCVCVMCSLGGRALERQRRGVVEGSQRWGLLGTGVRERRVGVCPWRLCPPLARGPLANLYLALGQCSHRRECGARLALCVEAYKSRTAERCWPPFRAAGGFWGGGEASLCPLPPGTPGEGPPEGQVFCRVPGHSVPGHRGGPWGASVSPVHPSCLQQGAWVGFTSSHLCPSEVGLCVL